MTARSIRRRAEAEIGAAMQRWSEVEMVWGRDDCMLAVADIVKAATGKDPARRFRGRYQTRRGAIRVLGPGGTERAARDSARALHWRKVDPAEAKPGDVGLMKIAARTARGRRVTTYSAVICRAPGWFVGRAERGFVALSAAKIERVWAIA